MINIKIILLQQSSILNRNLDLARDEGKNRYAYPSLHVNKKETTGGGAKRELQ